MSARHHLHHRRARASQAEQAARDAGMLTLLRARMNGEEAAALLARYLRKDHATTAALAAPVRTLHPSTASAQARL